MTSTVEALMYSLRKGPEALNGTATLCRLSTLDDDQLRDIVVRLQKLKPEIAQAWTLAQLQVLAAARRKLK